MTELKFNQLKTRTGVPLYVMSLPQANTVAVGVLIKAGTRDEQWPEEAGLAHALEHMLFQGTKKFPSQEKLGAYLEDVGGIINAWTWSETTFFWNQIPANYKDRSFIVLSEQLNQPLIPAEKIKTEMLNIIEEMKMSRDNPQDYLEDLARVSLYGNHPLGKLTLGKEEAVRKFKRSHFLNFKRRLYHSANYVFVVAGKITPQEALERFNQLFPHHSQQKPNRRKEVKLKDNRKRRFVFKKEIDQVNLRLVAPLGKANDKATKAIDLFSSMISGGLSSPLFQEVRNKLGLCYSVYAETVRFSDVGNFSIYIGTDTKRYQEAIKASLRVIEKSKTNKSLLEKTKIMELGHLALAYENPSSIINRAASQISQYGRPLDYAELQQEIKSITIQDIEEAVNRYLKPSEIRQVFLVPKELEIN